MSIWFTADTHFGHERTLELSKRPFETIEEMDNTLIENWNRVVGKNDLVWHLGDFGNYEVSNVLNGKINLLYGNYERKDIADNKITLSQLRNDYNFSSVLTKNMFDCRLGDLEISIVHEPSHMNSNNFNLFGHIHKLQMVKRDGLNVGVDCHNYTPIDNETVLFYKNAIENFYDEEVFI